MAIHKLNRFHWHLSDDQGWRIEIKRYPELAEFGGRRGPPMNQPEGPNGPRFSGTAYLTPKFYTQDEIAEIVDYAKDLNIEVIPEIDIPAHTAALIIGARHGVPPVDLGTVQLPHFCGTGADALGLDGAPNCMGDTAGILVPTNQTLQFLKDVFTEILRLFPSKYIHIGGDEANLLRDRVYNSAEMRSLKNAKGLTSSRAVQAYLTDEILQFLEGQGRHVIAWDETFLSLAPYRPPPKRSVLMWWRSWAGEAQWRVLQNLPYHLILTPISATYLDKYQMHANERSRFAVQPGTVTLADVYSVGQYNAPNILGVQACLWTEALKDWSMVEYQLFPRLCALAENAWTAFELRDWGSFLQRLEFHKGRLDAMGIGYYAEG